MTLYILLPTFAFFISFFTWTYVFAQQKRDPINTTFLLFAANNLGWISCDLLMYHPFTNQHELLIARICTFFWLPAGFWFLLFAYALVGKKTDWFLRGAGIAAALGVAFAVLSNQILIDLRHFEWGTAQIFHPIYHPLISIITAVTSAKAVFLILKKRRASKDTAERHSLALLIGGAITVMGFIAVVNVLMPTLLGIYNIPMLGSSAFTVFVVLVFWAVTRYRFLSISVEKVAEELFEDLQEGILLTDRSGRVLRSNAPAREILGTHPEGRDAQSLLFGCPTDADFTNAEISPRPNDPDGPTFALSASTIRRGEDVLGRIYIIRDITEQKRAENVLLRSKEDLEQEIKVRTQQLKHAQRMEAVGTLAGGIAHDFNNVLAVILGFANAAKHDTPKNNPIYGDIEEIIVAGKRGRDIVRQILTISRKQDTTGYVTENLSAIVHETVTLVKGSMPENISFQTVMPDAPIPIRCDATQIAQVLMNLCNNGVYAMKEIPKGTLTVGVELLLLDETEVKERDLPTAGRYARLFVRDTGCGIDETVCNQIFNPFFTTKPQGEGTGLGLATAFVIIQNHEGEIQVESKIGEGTEFSILLPILSDLHAQEEPMERRDSDFSAQLYPTAPRERILLVDDESQVRRMGNRVLTQLGYSVVTAESGEEALDKLSAPDHGFALVVTDYNMPKMTGVELAAVVRRKQIRVPIILMSGYGDKVTPEEIDSAGIAMFLPKPAPKKVLDSAIRQILD